MKIKKLSTKKNLPNNPNLIYIEILNTIYFNYNNENNNDLKSNQKNNNKKKK